MRLVVCRKGLRICNQWTFGVEGALRPGPLGDEAAESDQLDLHEVREGDGCGYYSTLWLSELPGPMPVRFPPHENCSASG